MYMYICVIYPIVDPLVHTIFFASVFLDILFILFQLVVFSIWIFHEVTSWGYFASPSCCVARCIKTTHVGLHGFLGLLFNVGSNEMRWHFVCGIWRRIWCCFIPVSLLFEDRVLRCSETCKAQPLFIQTFEKRGLLLSLSAAAIGQSGKMLNYRWQRKGLFTSTRFQPWPEGIPICLGTHILVKRMDPWICHNSLPKSFSKVCDSSDSTGFCFCWSLRCYIPDAQCSC